MNKYISHLQQFAIQTRFRIVIFSRYLLFKADNRFQILYRDGILILKGVYSKDHILEILANHENFFDNSYTDGSFQTSCLTKNEDQNILSRLEEYGILRICKNYLGKRVTYNENDVLNIGKEAYNTSIDEYKWMPHHDAKFNRLKIYIWSTPYSKDSFPLFYKKGSHNGFRYWFNHPDTRFNTTREEMIAVRGDIGDVIIFDTHGVHAHKKFKSDQRTIINFSLNPTHTIFGFKMQKSVKGNLIELK